MPSVSSSQTIASAIEPLRQKLLNHGLYGRLQSPTDLVRFMEHHVYAVWDFMSLLKELQRRLTCVEVPWVPRGNAAVRGLINEIVLGEESDRASDGSVCSHFELYLAAMREAGADIKPAERFIDQLRKGVPVPTALTTVSAPDCARRFVAATFEILTTGKDHEVAAAFTYGREDLIPSMFGQLVTNLAQQFPGRVGLLRYYLDRHIQLDGDHHAKLGEQMVADLCGQDEQRWQEARKAAIFALEQRLLLWDGIAAGWCN
ncbi:MAG: hypothetical protein JWQ71_2246 [Pedosphaera sp.]|nr:hypothetical protein [Pedosphaera sp.]